MKIIASIEEKNKEKQEKILNDHAEYLEAYSLRNRLSFTKLRRILFKSVPELKLFFMLSVQTDDDHLFSSVKKSITRPFPEVLKHLNVLFCK